MIHQNAHNKQPRRIGRRYDKLLRKDRYMALCINRHAGMPHQDGAIFPKRIDLRDTDRIVRTAERAIRALKADGASLTLYVSGAQYPLVAVINACLKYNVALTLMHYDPINKTYYPQKLYEE